MLVLSDGMLLYHGSYGEVSNIDIMRCKPGKDFGRGFYVTTSYEQAKQFIPLSIAKEINEGNLPKDHSDGYISVFRFHISPKLKVHIFPEADRKWLHFVIGNRRAILKGYDYEGFDIIGGKIANDRTARTLQIYLAEGYGAVGSEEADDIAIRTLRPNKLEDQLCFRTEKAIDSLEYIRGDRYEI